MVRWREKHGWCREKWGQKALWVSYLKSTWIIYFLILHSQLGMSQCDSPEEGKVQVLPDPTSGWVVLCWYPQALATDHERQRLPSPGLVFLKPYNTSLIFKKKCLKAHDKFFFGVQPIH